MILYPAIDLLNGQVVRLLHGDYRQATVYSDDPVAVARQMQSRGAQWLHIVDLNSAKNGGKENLPIIRKIAQATHLPIQSGGGVRDFQALEERLQSGVERAVVGTAVVTNPEFVEKALRQYGDRVAIGLDCLDKKVKIHGWTQDADLELFSLAAKWKKMGAKTIIYTDISKDGALSGPSFANTRQLIEESGLDIILSGGVHQDADIAKAKQIGAAGVIIGRAYYEGKIDLPSLCKSLEGE